MPDSPPRADVAQQGKGALSPFTVASLAMLFCMGLVMALSPPSALVECPAVRRPLLRPGETGEGKLAYCGFKVHYWKHLPQYTSTGACGATKEAAEFQIDLWVKQAEQQRAACLARQDDHWKARMWRSVKEAVWR